MGGKAEIVSTRRFIAPQMLDPTTLREVVGTWDRVVVEVKNEGRRTYLRRALITHLRAKGLDPLPVFAGVLFRDGKKRIIFRIRNGGPEPDTEFDAADIIIEERLNHAEP